MKRALLFFSFFLAVFSAQAKIAGQYTVSKGSLSKPVPAENSLDKVKIVEVFSFTCPYCNSINKKYPAFMKTFGDKVETFHYEVGWLGPNPGKFYYMANSLGIGDEAKNLMFSAFHDSNIKTINSPQILKFFAKELGISDEFNESFDDQKWFELFVERQKYINGFRVEATPTFIVEDSIVAKGDLDNLKLIINSLLKDPVK